jgi:pyrroline-5-carboxylate reductase
MAKINIGILGLGKMGEAVVGGLQHSKGKDRFSFRGTTHSAASAKEAAAHLKIPVSTDNAKLARESDVLLLCVKPHQARQAIASAKISPKQKLTLISVCTAITTEQLQTWIGKKSNVAIIRAMPNTPAVINRGMTALAAGEGVSESELKLAEEIFAAVGRTARVDESLFDGVTGLSGCGPAYAYVVIEALSEAGIKNGIPRETATLLAAQTLLGASQMVLDRGVHPAALKDEVTTPAGCTIDGLMVLEEGKLRATLIKAVLAATQRSKSLSQT